MMRLLIVEDDSASARALGEIAIDAGFQADLAADLGTARRLLEHHRYAAAMVDLELPDGDGLQLLPGLVEDQRAIVAIMSGQATVESAISALREGATDYFLKPIETVRLQRFLENAWERGALTTEVGNLREQLKSLGRFGRMVGSSTPMHELYTLIEQVAPTTASVLVRGETGTGKELVARTVHDLSPRRTAPFLAINCGAVAKELIASELFGHEKGAFTGAENQRAGCFERAHGGTLFLDEITETPPDLQVALLRVLQTGRFRRTGGDEELETDVRVVAATNRSLEEAVAEGHFREDLMYRLQVFPLELPPLRDRGEDIAALARHYLAASAKEHGIERAQRFSESALEVLAQHAWPGNVRELENAIQRASIVANEIVRPSHLPFAKSLDPALLEDPAQDVLDDGNVAASDAIRVPIESSIAEAEKLLIEATLQRLDDDKRGAAKQLGISLKTLYNRLATYRGVTRGGQ